MDHAQPTHRRSLTPPGSTAVVSAKPSNRVISAEQAAQHGEQVAELRSAGKRSCWLHFDPNSALTVIRVRDDGGRVSTLTPQSYCVRSGVHEYGGGAYAVTADGVAFVNVVDQGLYLQHFDNPHRISRLWWRSGARYGDLIYDPRHRRVIAVEEQHGKDQPTLNRLVAFDLASRCREVLAEGRDFYSSPRLSADGQRLAWVSWDHPHQPWLSCKLHEAVLDQHGRVDSVVELTSGSYLGQTEAVQQPEYGPEGILHFLSDRSGVWTLYRYLHGQISAVPGLDNQPHREYGVAPWQLGLRCYSFIGDHWIGCSFFEHGEAGLGLLDRRSGQMMDLPQSWSRVHSLTAHRGQLLAVVDNPETRAALIAVNPDDNSLQTLMQVGAESVVEGTVIAARHLCFATGPLLSSPQRCQDADPAYGFFYPPQLPASAGLPPLLLQIHGGPTAMANSAFDPQKQFWLQRGFAILDLNYRGSSGYGRRYRHALKEAWGVADVEDVLAAARHCVNQGWVDPQRIFVRGNSAGGYTVLRALAQGDAASLGLCAGASHYGISDLERLNRETHKFESHYLHWLIGDPQQHRQRYIERSPIHHPQRLQLPVIFFQGGLDPVVPATQTYRLYQQLRQRTTGEAGPAVEYLAFADERHGFKQAANRARVLARESAFYQRLCGLPVSGGEEIQTSNQST